MRTRYWLPLAALVILLLGVAALQADDAWTLCAPALGVVAVAGMDNKQLTEKRGQLIKQAQALVQKAKTEGRDLTAEEDAQFSEMLDDADACKAELDRRHTEAQAATARQERLDQATEQQSSLVNYGIDPNTVAGSAASANLPGNNTAPTPEDHMLAIAGWFLNQSPRSDVTIEDRHRQAAQRVGLRLDARELVLNLDLDFQSRRVELMNALQTTGGASGGYLRPQGFQQSLETAMLWYGGMMNVAEVMRTPTAAPFPWPTANDTANTGRQIGEAKAVANATDPAFAQRWMYAYKFTTDEIFVSYELIRDNPINLVPILGGMLGERLGRILNTKFTTGTGAATPYGIVPSATVGKTTTSATAIAATELIDLQHSVDKAYRDQPGVGWMFSDSVSKALRKLTDGSGSYFLWQDGLRGGEPATLLQKPVQINNDMTDSIAADEITMLFGLLSKYKIRQVNTVRIYRLVERHRENDQDAFLAFTEADGRLLDAGGHPVKSLKQHS